jgi:hypothetical protein
MTGIRERIKVAKSTHEVDTLLEDARHFVYSSNKTRNAWVTTAAKRKKELTSGQSLKGNK